MGCDTVGSACNGGFVDNGFAFAEKNGLCSDASYSYTTTKGACKDSCCTVDIVQGSVTDNSEQALMSAVAQQPVPIALETDQSSLQSYSSSVLTATCGVLSQSCGDQSARVVVHRAGLIHEMSLQHNF